MYVENPGPAANCEDVIVFTADGISFLRNVRDILEGARASALLAPIRRAVRVLCSCVCVRGATEEARCFAQSLGAFAAALVSSDQAIFAQFEHGAGAQARSPSY